MGDFVQALAESPPLRGFSGLIFKGISCYRRYISPLLPHACRFYPSCSVYALGALRRHGLWRGSWLSLWRLCRCHPFYRWPPDPFDPVP